MANSKTSRIVRKFERFMAQVRYDMQHQTSSDTTEGILLGTLHYDFENDKEVFIPATIVKSIEP